MTCVPLLALALAAPPGPLRFADGDRVVLLGGTLIEREQQTGHWETALLLANRPAKVTFRNLGWSGDTVRGEARNGFDDNPKGFERLVSLTLELKPTVVVVAYGQNESFAGPAGVAPFRAGLTKLLDALAPSKARFVLMTPPPFAAGRGLSDPAGRNAALAPYLVAIRETASARGAGLVDLHALAAHGLPTENGVHPTPDGYRAAAGLLAPADLSTSEAEQVRAAVVAKNELFFHRWRPQNQTYLFGFRKHEQGQNAKEIAQFDPLVEKAEAGIFEMLKQ